MSEPTSADLDNSPVPAAEQRFFKSGKPIPEEWVRPDKTVVEAAAARAREELVQKGYKTEEVPTIEEAMLNLSRQLKPGLEAGKYKVIVGDDTSGRIPTLVVKGVSDRISNQNGIEKVPTVFLRSGRGFSVSEVTENFVKTVLPRVGVNQRALIVTDYVDSGGTLRRLSNIFRSYGIQFDASIMTYSGRENALTGFPTSTQLFVGGNGFPGAIYDNDKLRGIYKGGELIKGPTHPNPQEENYESRMAEYETWQTIHNQFRQKVVVARADVKTMVNRITQQI